jgi:hypothetical protein
MGARPVLKKHNIAGTGIMTKPAKSSSLNGSKCQFKNQFPIFYFTELASSPGKSFYY